AALASLRMSAITSASGSTDFPDSAAGGAASAAPGLFSPLISASTSASGSTTSDLNSETGGAEPPGVTGAAGAPPSMSAPRKAGGAEMTPVSLAQSFARRPVANAIIIKINSPTITSETIPTRSDLSRFHASAQSPGETVCGISRTIRTGAFGAAPLVIGAPVVI